jgi:hypothetical protein
MAAVAVALFGFAGAANASTVALTPSTINVAEGKTFTVTTTIYPESVKVYGVQLVVSYPTDVLEATNATIESGWLTAGSPKIDAAAGTVTAMAGIGGGFDTSKTLGTITFTAKKSGTATIAVGTGTNVTNAQGGNTVSTRGTTAVTVFSASQATTQAPAVQQNTITTTAVTPKTATGGTTKTTVTTKGKTGATATTVAASSSASSTASTTDDVSGEGTGTQQVAAVNTFGTLGTYWWIIVLALIAIAGGAWALVRSKRR